MFRRRTLATQILAGVLGILVVTSVVGTVLVVRLIRGTLERQYQQRAVGIAAAVAQIPEVRAALAEGAPSAQVQALASEVMRQTGAAYVVVIDSSGVRYSHPNPALIGQRVSESVVALDGHEHVTMDHGSLGLSANGKAPVFAADGSVVGEVSVGILFTVVAAEQRDTILAIVVYTAIALAAGVVASWLLSRRVKRATFGLEPAQITALLQEREAMLHDISEGVIALDERQHVSLVNREAIRLLGLTGDAVGRPLDDALPPGRLRELVGNGPTDDDGSVLTADSLLRVDHRPVVVAGRRVGSVVTVLDRTDNESLVRELRAMSGLTLALRAQEHEYANRLHVATGLLSLGQTEEAAQYLEEIAATSGARAEDLRSRIAAPLFVALLVAKTALAAEQAVELVVTADSVLSERTLDRSGIDQLGLISIVGNLIDNAVEAMHGYSGERRVTLRLREGPDERLLVEVTDTGPGVPADIVEDLFVDGYTTRRGRGTTHRGLGLALVERIVRRAGGSVQVRPGPGARFVVELPLASAARSSP